MPARRSAVSVAWSRRCLIRLAGASTSRVVSSVRAAMSRGPARWPVTASAARRGCLVGSVNRTRPRLVCSSIPGVNGRSCRARRSIRRRTWG